MQAKEQIGKMENSFLDGQILSDTEELDVGSPPVPPRHPAEKSKKIDTLTKEIKKREDIFSKKLPNAAAFEKLHLETVLSSPQQLCQQIIPEIVGIIEEQDAETICLFFSWLKKFKFLNEIPFRDKGYPKYIVETDQAKGNSLPDSYRHSLDVVEGDKRHGKTSHTMHWIGKLCQLRLELIRSYTASKEYEYNYRVDKIEKALNVKCTESHKFLSNNSSSPLSRDDNNIKDDVIGALPVIKNKTLKEHVNENAHIRELGNISRKGLMQDKQEYREERKKFFKKMILKINALDSEGDLNEETILALKGLLFNICFFHDNPPMKYTLLRDSVYQITFNGFTKPTNKSTYLADHFLDELSKYLNLKNEDNKACMVKSFELLRDNYPKGYIPELSLKSNKIKNRTPNKESLNLSEEKSIFPERDVGFREDQIFANKYSFFGDSSSPRKKPVDDKRKPSENKDTLEVLETLMGVVTPLEKKKAQVQQAVEKKKAHVQAKTITTLETLLDPKNPDEFKKIGKMLVHLKNNKYLKKEASILLNLWQPGYGQFYRLDFRDAFLERIKEWKETGELSNAPLIDDKNILKKIAKKGP